MNILERVHNTGYVYNDLKLDNLLINFDEKLPRSYTEGNSFENIHFNLVDFGFATKYLDK